MVTTSTCYFLLLFQPPNIKYGVISTSSLGEKVLSANHGDPSRQTSGSEQVSPKPNPAEGIFLLDFSGPVSWTEGGRKSTQWFQIGFANRLWLILPEVCRKTTSWMKFQRTWWKINWNADKLLTERITFPWHWNFLNESECNYVAGKHQLTKCVCVCV